MEKRDPMEMYTSKPKKFGQVVKEVELQAKRDQSEWQQQLIFCRWLKHEYPDILFRSDTQSAGKLSPGMQNIKQIVDPYSGWPDIQIYEETGNYNGLMLEMKRIGASLSGEHYKQQALMHDKLRAQNWKVVVCFGAEEAKRVFLEYLEM